MCNVQCIIYQSLYIPHHSIYFLLSLSISYLSLSISISQSDQKTAPLPIKIELSAFTEDWDDQTIEDDFANQLRAELQKWQNKRSLCDVILCEFCVCVM